jgi:hypothetical protein
MPDVNSPNQGNQGAPSAAFVATGKVIKLNASTLPDVETANTLILQVESVIKSPSLFADLAGHQVTIRFDKLPNVNEGAEMTVYANGWVFGATVGLDAVSYTLSSDRQVAAAGVAKETAATEDADLKDRLNSAATVVVGKVSKVEKKPDDPAMLARLAPNENQTTRISEHDPNWHEATIQVNQTLKGAEAPEIKVLFPQSDDVRWHGVQKFEEGQQGIWLLQNSQNQNTKGIAPKLLAAVPRDVPALTALHPNDFVPLNDLGKIKSLLQN